MSSSSGITTTVMWRRAMSLPSFSRPSEAESTDCKHERIFSKDARSLKYLKGRKLSSKRDYVKRRLQTWLPLNRAALEVDRS
jgi:hypothetical protein